MMFLAFIVLSAVCKSIMDTCETLISFNASKLNKWGFDRNFWCKPISSVIGFIPFTKYRPDAWHIFNSLNVVFFASAVVSYQQLIYPLADFFVIGIVWNMTFNFLYNYLKQ